MVTTRKYYKLHRREIRKQQAEYYQRNKEQIKSKHRQLHAEVLQHVARFWGDETPRCRFDTLPKNHPLKEHVCYGKLQLDHMDGKGAKEFRTLGNWKVYTTILRGERSLSNLRLLCQLHQLWNTI